MKAGKVRAPLLIAALMGAAACAGYDAAARASAMESRESMEERMDNPMVGGAAMYPSMNIIENAVNSKDHTTLVAAVKAAGLVETLSGPGPFTVFAPTNAAFDALPEGTVESLLKPENKGTLTRVLTYHVVPGKLDSAALTREIEAGDGKASLTTVAGDPLVVTASNGEVVITDENGNVSRVTIADVYQSNGVIHVVDTVVQPR